jgi:hypothetical protein
VVVLCTLAGVLIAQYVIAWSKTSSELVLWLIAALGLSGAAWNVWTNRWGRACAWATGLALAGICAYLVVFVAQPRYLGFPVDLLWLFLAAQWLRRSQAQPPQRVSQTILARRASLMLGVLALIAFGLASAMLRNEGWHNAQALEAWLVVAAIGIGVLKKLGRSKTRGRPLA